jgi:hypothetical protein
MFVCFLASNVGIVLGVSQKLLRARGYQSQMILGNTYIIAQLQ